MDRRHFLALSVALPLLSTRQAFAAPKADLWERWTRHDPAANGRVDHSGWDALLGRYLTQHADGIVRVDYQALAARRSDLRTYLALLADTPVSTFARPEQFAFWVNLYNALTLDVVLEHWPVNSIRDIDISPGLFANGPWGAKLAIVEGVDVSLDDIEHRILRPIWKDPRIHYAVNCASIGCPNLAKRAYTGDRLEAMLNAGAQDYVGHPRGVSVRNGRVTASKIYDWFQEDFGGTEAGVLAHLRQYGADGLQSAGGIDDYAYDWSLNAA